MHASLRTLYKRMLRHNVSSYTSFTLAANQKLSNLLHLLPPSNLVAFLSILAKTVYTDYIIGASDYLSLS